MPRTEYDDSGARARSRAPAPALRRAAKVNDTVNAKMQLSTVNSGDDSPRSTNQTQGDAWNRKTIGIDLAYVDWKPSRHVQPAARQASPALGAARRATSGTAT